MGLFARIKQLVTGKVTPRPGLCSCARQCTWAEVISSVDCWLQNDVHVSFRLLRCHECGGLDGLIKEDFQRALKDGTAETKAILQQRIDNP